MSCYHHCRSGSDSSAGISFFRRKKPGTPEKQHKTDDFRAVFGCGGSARLPETRGGNTPDGRKVKGTVHWVDAATAVDAEVRLYSLLFSDPDPDASGKDFIACLNPDSLETLKGCKLEAALADAKAGDGYQFMRLGYFCADKDSTPDNLIFNRSVSLKDSFRK